MDTLDFKLKVREGSKNKTPREYQDFIINGRSLSKLLGEPDLVGTIGSFGKKVDTEAAKLLLLIKKSELESKRIPIYICPECGGLECGAITISITQDEEFFTWSFFGYENNYQNELLKVYKEIGPFSFPKEDYIKLLKQLYNPTT